MTMNFLPPLVKYNSTENELKYINIGLFVGIVVFFLIIVLSIALVTAVCCLAHKVKKLKK